MDGNSSIVRRYSFNIAQASPVAESTQLGNSFSWGSSPSIRPRSNSSLSLSHANSPSRHKNVTKIDARVVADVQSKGLASRIVKYHEGGARLNRSLSCRNLYTRPGQFPAVTLKKTDLPYRAKKQELSIIRIPPPERSMYYGNSISSLLKSNSVVGLKSKRTEDNRPIIHPPPSENDLAPTRSVLEVLKEISRKRINSDDLEADETSKKYCNRGVSDFTNAATCTASTTMASQRFKRQRDCASSHQGVHISEAKTSPEQVKKRICKNNNDITSSLSSSAKSRCNEVKRASYSNNQTTSSNLESYETQKTKLQSYLDHQNNNDQADARLKGFVNNSCKAELIKPITPIPTTPCVLNDGNSGIVDSRPVNDSYYCSNGKALNEIQSFEKPRLTLFNKKYDVGTTKESIGKSDELNNSEEYIGIPFVKPKKTSIISLKNPVIERTQKSKLALMLSGLKGEIYQNFDKDETDLSKEKVDDKKLNGEENAFIAATKSVSTATTTSNTTTTLTTVTSSCNLNNEVLTTTSSSKLNTNTTADVKSSTTSNKTSSPLVGLKLTQAKSSSINDNASSANDIKTTTTNSGSNIPVLGGFPLSVPNTNILPTAFTPTTSKSPVNPTLTVAKAGNLVMAGEPKCNFSFGINLPSTKDNVLPSPLVSTNSINSSSSNISVSTANTLKPINTYTFGVNAAPTSTTATNTSKSVERGSLSFTNNVTELGSSFNSSVPTQALKTPVTSSMSGFLTTGGIAFGAVTPSTTSTVTSLTPNTTSAPVAIAKTPTSSTSTSTFSSQPSTTNFTFNLTPNTTSVPVAITKTPTSSTSTSSFSSQPSTTTFTFNANNAGKAIQSSNSLFSFNSLSTTKSSDSGDKNVSNLFNSNASTFFGGSNLKGSDNTQLLDNTTTNNIDKKFVETSNFVFGSNSMKSDSQILGSSADNKSTTFAGSNSSNTTTTSICFGTKPSGTETGNSNTGGFSFGSSVPKCSEGGAFPFGNTITPTMTKSPNNIFGTASENKTFTFGSTNKNENTTASPGGFSFSTAAQKPKFSFCANGNSTAGFSFSGVTSPLPAETSINKSFSFRTQQPQAPQTSIPVSNAVSSNIFGSPAPNKPVPQPSFNFNTANYSNLQQTEKAANIFAAPVSNITTGPGDRQIRRATRRLQK